MKRKSASIAKEKKMYYQMLLVCFNYLPSHVQCYHSKSILAVLKKAAGYRAYPRRSVACKVIVAIMGLNQLGSDSHGDFRGADLQDVP